MIELSEIVLGSENDAAAVLEALRELKKRYKFVFVADYLELVGLSTSLADQRWGWTELNEVPIKQVEDGFLLELPAPTPYRMDAEMPNADARIALRDAIRYDKNVRGMAYGDIAHKHDITVNSVTAALENDEIEFFKIPLTQIDSGVTSYIKVITSKGTTYKDVAENWKAF